MDKKVLDKASAIATETLEKIKEETISQNKKLKDSPATVIPDASEQPKDGSPDSSQENKIEGQETQKDAEAIEAEANEKVRLLSSDEKDLSDEDKVKKAELVKAEESKPITPEKLKKFQENTQKRIDQLVAELASERDGRTQDKSKITNLENQISNLNTSLENSGMIESPESKVKDQVASMESDRLKKYETEDKDKPFKERREMSKEALQEFLDEDYAEATEWIAERSSRRVEDRRADKDKLEASGRADDFYQKQDASRAKLLSKYPGINQSARGDQLKSQGMTDAQITDQLMSENADFKMMMDVYNKNPEKYLTSVDGPELIMAEMDKLKASPEGDDTPKMYTEAELEQAKAEAVKAESDRQASIDEGHGSSVSQTTIHSNLKKDPQYQKGLELFLIAAKRQKKDWGEKEYLETLERRNAIPQ